jgi:hypothetical protein
MNGPRRIAGDARLPALTPIARSVRKNLLAPTLDAGSFRSWDRPLPRLAVRHGYAEELAAAQLISRRDASIITSRFRGALSASTSFLILDVLDGSGQQAELVALGITQYHPTDVGALTDVCSPRAEGEQALELLGCGNAIRPEIEMQPVLDDLSLGHRYHIDGRPGLIRRSDADYVAILFDNMPAEDGAPELGHHPWPDRIDGNDSYVAGHATTIAREIASKPSGCSFSCPAPSPELRHRPFSGQHS